VIPELSAGTWVLLAGGAVALWYIAVHFMRFPGVTLGFYEVVGRYGGRFLHEIRAVFVDCTDSFLSPEIEAEFKAMIKEEIDAMPQDAQKNFKDLREKIDELPMGEAFRVVGGRTPTGKHLLIQYGNTDKYLSEYASISRSAKISFAYGFTMKGKIFGDIHPLPERWAIPGFGLVNMYLFNPVTPHEDTANPDSQKISLDAMQSFAKVAVFTKTWIETKSLLKAKDERIRDLEARIQDERGESAAYTRLGHSAVKAAGLHQPGMKTPDLLKLAGRRDLTGWMIGLAVAAFIGATLFEQLKIADPKLGAVAAVLGLGLYLARRV